MLRKLLILLVLAGIGYWGWRHSHHAKQIYDNSALTAQVLAKIAVKKPASLLSLKVSSDRGIVDLQGHLRSARDEDDVLNLVKSVHGVSEIHDRISLDRR